MLDETSEFERMEKTYMDGSKMNGEISSYCG